MISQNVFSWTSRKNTNSYLLAKAPYLGLLEHKAQQSDPSSFLSPLVHHSVHLIFLPLLPSGLKILFLKLVTIYSVLVKFVIISKTQNTSYM